MEAAWHNSLITTLSYLIMKIEELRDILLTYTKDLLIHQLPINSRTKDYNSTRTTIKS